jgi:hypothetical protein
LHPKNGGFTSRSSYVWVISKEWFMGANLALKAANIAFVEPELTSHAEVSSRNGDQGALRITKP